MAVTNMTADEVRTYMNEHRVDEYTLLDVRQDWEYDEFHLPGAKLMPLPKLPDRLAELPKERPVITYCKGGVRSSSAAGLLAGQGYQVVNLLGGVDGWEGAGAMGDQTFGLTWFSGREKPLEVLRLAYAMEANLGTFYSRLASKVAIPALAETFGRLAKLEDAHKAMVVRLARSLNPALTATDLEGGPKVLEGGWTEEDLWTSLAGEASTPGDALEAGMGFEAQALDLYLRYATHAIDPAAAQVLRQLADEERKHLRVLGDLYTRENVRG